MVSTDPVASQPRAFRTSRVFCFCSFLSSLERPIDSIPSSLPFDSLRRRLFDWEVGNWLSSNEWRAYERDRNICGSRTLTPCLRTFGKRGWDLQAPQAVKVTFVPGARREPWFPQLRVFVYISLSAAPCFSSPFPLVFLAVG